MDVERETKIIYPGRPARVTIGPRGRVFRRGGAPAVVATIDDARSLRFVLHVDGKAMSNFVQVGRDNKRPHQLPLIVNLR